MQSSCLNQEHQVAMATHLYVVDYDDIFPLVLDRPVNYGEPTSNWFNWRIGVSPYLKSKIACPIASSDQSIPDNFRWGYCLNYHTHLGVAKQGSVIYTPKAVRIVANPERTVLTAECKLFDIVSAWPDNNRLSLTPFAATDILKTHRNALPASTRHFGGANYAFVDGSVRWATPDRFGGDESPFTFLIPKE